MDKSKEVVGNMNTQEQQLVENDKSGNSSEENQEIDLRTILIDLITILNEFESIKIHLEKLENEVKLTNERLELMELKISLLTNLVWTNNGNKKFSINECGRYVTDGTGINSRRRIFKNDCL